MKEVLKNLNEEQRSAVLHTTGPLMILAGAGSGKTRTLVTKISYLIETVGVSPFKVLALTFSNKAAREMRDRISTQVSSDAGALSVTTFHAFCARVLRSEAQYIGLSRNFTIYDTSESKAVIKQVLSRHGISTKELSPFEVMNYNEGLNNLGYYVGIDNEEEFDLDRSDPFFTYYNEYNAELRKSNAVDFGGLITGVIHLFEKFPDVLKKYVERFEYILVDEYQDTNRAQFKLLNMLSKEKRNICVVGDEDQSIYSWRGADIRNILEFEENYPEVQVLKLEQNYRSSRNIIEAASSVISRNIHRKGKEMWTSNPTGDEIEVVECFNEKEEAEFITKTILDLSKEGHSTREMAVFYRTNAQSRTLEDQLRRANIPYRVVGGVKFYERKEIKDMLAYLRVVVNEKDSLAYSRIVNVPSRGIGATTLRKLETVAVRDGLSLPQVVETIVDNLSNYKDLKLSAKVRSSLSMLSNMFMEARLSDSSGKSPVEIYEGILHESGYWDSLKARKDYESQARLENLEELSSAIKQYESSTEKPSLGGFLETVTLDTSNEEDTGQDLGEVSLMTIHGAKGLEFNHVFLTGVEENIFPSIRSLEESQDFGLEEERRLFYVAMTRAMEKLFICFAQGRMLYGQLKFNGPSRFINEIPNKYYHWKKVGKITGSSSGFSNDNNEYDDFNQECEFEDDEKTFMVSKNAPASKFNTGAKVIHSLYGEGSVINSEGTGQDEKVTIKFKDGVNKKFMVKFAPLTLI
ncbi:MAG: UvrD-helicase domain-containing protein [Bacteriovoracaceae bacterium]|nr:UvrD-helicase domain-containing protein [Bacteriovoracaceae bacterium]